MSTDSAAHRRQTQADPDGANHRAGSRRGPGGGARDGSPAQPAATTARTWPSGPGVAARRRRTAARPSGPGPGAGPPLRLGGRHAGGAGPARTGPPPEAGGDRPAAPEAGWAGPGRRAWARLDSADPAARGNGPTLALVEGGLREGAGGASETLPHRRVPRRPHTTTTPRPAGREPRQRRPFRPALATSPAGQHSRSTLPPPGTAAPCLTRAWPLGRGPSYPRSSGTGRGGAAGTHRQFPGSPVVLCGQPPSHRP